MLKAQLRSKLFQFDPDWRDIEDLVTGDFFGVLDYLPRQPFLREFLELISTLNANAMTWPVDLVDWDAIEILFWPRHRINGESTEPDIVIRSNQWVLVIEVKLRSGLGRNQPWREFQVGQQLAQEMNLPGDSVQYVILSRDRMDQSVVLGALSDAQRRELGPRTAFLRWSEVIALVQGWLPNGTERQGLTAEMSRMLHDLYAVLRLRRTLAFSGFSFPHLQRVCSATQPIFCPSTFEGFQKTAEASLVTAPSRVFFSPLPGFLNNVESMPVREMRTMGLDRFAGFLRSAQRTHALSRIFCPALFHGFLRDAPRCLPLATMAPCLHEGDRQP